MIAFGHTAVGAMVGLAGYHLLGNGNPIVGVGITGAAGIVSHYIFDVIPHGHFFREGNYKEKIKYVIVFDFGLSLLIFTGLAYIQQDISLKLLYFLAGLSGSQLPDILDGLIYSEILPNEGFFKVENKFHQATHWHGVKEKALLISKWDLWQVITVLLALYLTFKY